MQTQPKILKWKSKLNSKTAFSCARARRAACQKLAADQTAQAVPFLVSALADSDEEIRRIAEQGLRSLSDPVAIEALRLGLALTSEPTVREILSALGQAVDEGPDLQPYLPPEATLATEVWQLRSSRDGTVLAFVPEGEFMAGEQNTSLHLPAYYIALTCVTNVRYAQFLTERRPKPADLESWISLSQCDAIKLEANTYVVESGKADLPVVWVTWEGVQAYCKWAGLRLPTELEWEKAARGVDGRLYPWGNEWEEGRPLPTTKERKPEQVTSVWEWPTARSPYGLYQMIGNVYEWCADWYEANAYERYAQGDFGPARGEHRVLRGGPWRFGTPAHLRTESRKSTVWRAGTLLCGFRCAKTP